MPYNNDKIIELKDSTGFVHGLINYLPNDVSDNFEGLVGESFVWVNYIQTHTEHRGLGFGTERLKAFENKCIQTGVKAIIGKFRPENGYETDLESFYTKNGYKIVESELGGKFIFKSLIAVPYEQ